MLKIGRVEAQILIAHGFTSLEEVAYVPDTEMHAITEFTHEQITQIRTSAKEHLLKW